MENQQPTEKETAFCIDNEGAANWFLGKLADLEAEKQRIQANTAKRVAELDADAARLHHLFGEQFKEWAQSEADRRRRKTVTLPNGCAAFRTVPARFVIADQEAAFVHARTFCPDAIKQAAPVLDAVAYVKAAEETGELLPGVDRQPAREAFKIDVSGGKAKPKEAEPDAEPEPEAEPDERHGFLKRLFPK